MNTVYLTLQRKHRYRQSQLREELTQDIHGGVCHAPKVTEHVEVSVTTDEKLDLEGVVVIRISLVGAAEEDPLGCEFWGPHVQVGNLRGGDPLPERVGANVMQQIKTDR